MTTTEAQNKAFVLEAFDTLFNKRDYAARGDARVFEERAAHVRGQISRLTVLKAIIY
jgi:hypothetical protein